MEEAELSPLGSDRPPWRPEPRWRPVTRFLVSILLAGGLTGALWLRVPNSLLGPTDIVGYPIYANFDIYRYTYGYYFIALLFPALAILIFLLISWKGPLRRLQTPTARVLPLTNDFEGPSVAPAPPPAVTPRRHPPAPDIDAAHLVQPQSIQQSTRRPTHEPERDDHEPERVASPLESVRATFWLVARVALVVFAIILECSIIQTGNQHVVTFVGVVAGVIYVVAVALGALLFASLSSGGRHSTRTRPPSTWRSGVARANSMVAILTVPLLWFVSQSTEVDLGRGPRIVHYPWLPWWVAAALTLVCILAWYRGMSRATTLAARQHVESNVLTWIIGPLLVFLITAALPGALGTFSGFDDAQYLASPQLILQHGLLPWRDIYLLHGILQDVLDTWVGLVTFGNTRWGGAAGLSMFTFPLGWMTVYAFAAFFCRKNRLFLVAMTGIILGGFLLGVNPRFIPLPVIVILFDLVLRRATRGWCWLFTLVLFVEVLVAPEAGLFVPCLFGVLVIREITDRDRVGWSLSNFPRTVRCLAAGLTLSLGWLVYLGVTGSLTSFLDYFLVFSSGHVLEGGVPTNWPVFHVSVLSLLWVLPPTLWLLTIVRVTVKLRLRRRWTATDWVMVATAVMALVYFPKALDRADAGHINEAISATIPLLILWLIEILAFADRAIGRLIDGVRGRFRPPSLRHVATGLLVVALAAESGSLPASLPASVANVPADFHPAIAAAAVSRLPRLGYTIPGRVDTGQIRKLQSVLDRFAGPDAPVFDYADEPGVLYYLLNRVPGTRFYYSAVSQTAGAQSEEIADLRASRPPVVIFTDTAFGLPEYDGVIQPLRSFAVTSYLLANYRPVLNVEGQLVMLRNDLDRSQFPIGTGSTSRQLYFDTASCDFGYIPNFSSLPNSTSAQNTVEVPVGTPPTSRQDTVTVGGWGLRSPTVGPIPRWSWSGTARWWHRPPHMFLAPT